MPAIGSVNVKVSATTGGLTSGLNTASSSLSNFGSKIQGIANSGLGTLGSGLNSAASGVASLTTGLGSLALKAGVVGGAFMALRGAYSALTSGISGAAQFEQSSVAFEVLLGDADKAKVMLMDLEAYATKSPFTIKGVNESAQQLMNYGIAGDKILPTIKMLGDVAAGDADKMQRLGTAFGQMSATGRLMGQDLLQFINAGFNPLQEISKKTGESMSDLKKRMEAGGIASSEVEGAFQAATSAGGRFYGMTEKQSKSLSGLWNSLTENISIALRDVSSTLLEAFDVKTTLSNLTNFTSSVKAGVQSIVPVIKSVAAVLGTAWDLYVSYASSVFTAFGATTSTTFEDIKTTAIGALDWIKSGLESLKPTAIALGTLVGQTWATIAAGAQTAFNFIATAGMTLYTNVASVFSSLTEGSGITFTSIADGAFTAVGNVIGFFWNLGDNLKTLWTWFGTNWTALLSDMTTATLTFATNSLKNFATLFNGMFRVVTVWQGWTIGLFKRLFSFEIMDAVMTGLISIGTAIRDWASAAWDTITSIFSGDAPSGALDNFISQAKSDLKMGMDNLDISASLGTVLKETAADLVGPLEGFKSTLKDAPDLKLDIPGLNKALKPVAAPTPPPTMPAPPTMATGPEGISTPADAMSKSVETATKPKAEAVGGLNRGSKEATSAIYAAMRNNNSGDGEAKSQLKAANQANKYLATIAAKPSVQIVAGRVNL